MAMTPSQLSIIVNSKGIKESTDELNNLAKAAASVDAETKSFVIAQQRLAEANNKVSKTSEATARGVTAQELALIKAHTAANKMNDAMVSASVKQQLMADGKLSKELDRQAAASERAAKAAEAHERGMVKQHIQALKMNDAFDKHAKGLDEVSRRGNVYVNTLRSMATAALAYVGVNFAKGLFESADGWSMMQAKLSLATGSMRAAVAVQESLFKTAQEIRIPLEDAAKLYNRLAQPLMVLGKTSKETSDVVSSMGFALKLSGATGQEAASAMLQFSQSVNAGRLNGGEFNSVYEASPNIIRAIEAELVRLGRGAELAKDGIKKMASEGKVTVEIMSNAMLRALPQWRKDFETLPLTVDGALVRIKNMWEKTIGVLAQDTGFAKNFTKLLQQLEDNIPNIAKVVVSAFSLMIEYAGLFTKSLGFIMAVGLASWAYEALWGAKGVVAGMNAAQVATKGLAASMAFLNSATGVIGLVAAGVWAAYEAYKYLNEERDKAAKTQEELVNSSVEYLKGLQAESDMLFKQVNLLREKRGLPALEDPSKQGQEGKKLVELESEKNRLIREGNILQKEAATLAESLNKIATKSSDPSRVFGYDAGVARLQELNTKIKTIGENLVNGEKELTTITMRRFAAQVNGNAASTESYERQLKQLTQVKEKADEVYEKTKKIADEALAKGADKGGISQETYNKMIKAAEILRDSKKEDVRLVKAEITEVDKLKITYSELAEQQKDLQKYGIEDVRTKTEKEYNKLVEEGGRVKGAALKLDYDKRIAQALLNKNLEDANIAIRKQLEQEQEANNTSEKRIQNAQTELDKNTALLKSDEERAEVIAKLTAAKQYDVYVSAVKNGATIQEIERQKELFDILKQNAGVVGNRVDKDALQKQSEANKKILDDMWDTTKVDKFESATSKALKGMAKGFVDVTKALSKYGAAKATIEARTKANNEEYDTQKISDIQYLKNKSKIEQDSAEYQMAAYASTADAAKNFFKEGSKGYQAMDAVAKVYHAAQMVRNLAEMSGLATKAVLNQAGGDPYSAIPRMAAMAAIVAGLGFATGMFGSSDSGGMKAADVQKAQGAGSVFGDSDAKSESISNSLELLKKSYDKLYPVNQGMLKALKNIESSMTGLTNLVLRSEGVVEGSNLGIKEGVLSQGVGGIGGILGGILSKLWGKTTQNIVDSGIQFGGSLSAMQSGQGFNQYASVDTTKSSWFGLKKSTTNSVQTQGLSNELSSQLGLVFTNMQKSLEEAGKALYGSSEGVTKALDSLVISTSKISLKGLSGDALTNAINAVISKGLDEMAQAAFANFDQYRQVGEGYAQTIMRVANNFVTVNATFSKLGMKLLDTSDAGIKASDSFIKLFDSLENMQSVASEYYDKFYTEQEKQEKITGALKKQFTEMNLVLPDSVKAYRALVDSTTDPEKLATLWKLSSAFYEVFGSIEDGAKEIPQQMKDMFDKLSKDTDRWYNLRSQASSLKDSVSSAMGNPQKDPAIRIKQLWDAMAADVSPEQKMQLAGELKDLVLSKYQVEKDSMQKLIDFGKQLRSYVESLKLGALSPMTVGQKLAEAKRQYDETLAKAQGGDTTAQGSLQGKAESYLQLAQTAFASSSEYVGIFNSVTGSLDSLGMESLTAAEVAQNTANSQLLELQKLYEFATTVETTANNYYNASVLELTKQTLIMDATYKQLGVLNGMTEVLSTLPAEIAVAVSSGLFVTKLYETLAGKTGSEIDTTGMEYWLKEVGLYGREYVLKAFQDAVAKAPITSPIVIKPTDTTTVLQETVVALKDEIAALREDQNKQTEALIAATVISNQQNASEVVEGVDDAFNKKNWKEVNAPALV
jgi:tape measure domain-containing protein